MWAWFVKARLSAPTPLRHIYRMLKSVMVKPHDSYPLPQHLLENCRVVGDRHILLDKLPKGGVIAELGVFEGEFTNEILKRCSPDVLHLFDMDFGRTDPAVLSDPRVTSHTGILPESISVLENESCDWIYIDADHSYNAVTRDAEAAISKLKPGGLLIFNDFASIDQALGRYGVHRAVCEFANKYQWQIVWFAFHPGGLYDVALQKPIR